MGNFRATSRVAALPQPLVGTLWEDRRESTGRAVDICQQGKFWRCSKYNLKNNQNKTKAFLGTTWNFLVCFLKQKKKSCKTCLSDKKIKAKSGHDMFYVIQSIHASLGDNPVLLLPLVHCWLGAVTEVGKDYESAEKTLHDFFPSRFFTHFDFFICT